MNENEKTTNGRPQQDWIDAVRSAHTSTLDTIRRMYSVGLGQGDPDACDGDKPFSITTGLGGFAARSTDKSTTDEG